MLRYLSLDEIMSLYSCSRPTACARKKEIVNALGLRGGVTLLHISQYEKIEYKYLVMRLNEGRSILN